MRKRNPAMKLLVRGFAALLVLMGMLVSIVEPAAAQAADPGLISDTEYASPQFDFTMTWDDPWSVVDDSVESNDGGFDKIELESANAFAQIILLFPTDDPQAYLDVLATNAEDSGTDYEEIGTDSGNGYDSTTVEFTYATQSGDLRVREYIEVGEISSADGKDTGLFTGSLLAPVDEFEAEWQSLLDTVERDGKDLLFAGEPEGIGGSSTSTKTNTKADPTPTADNGSDRTAGIDGDVFIGPNYGFSVSWDDSLWTPDDLSTKSDDVLVLTSDTAELKFSSSTTLSGDVKTCASENANILRETEGITKVGRATSYPLPDAPKGSFARLYKYTDTSGTRDVLYLNYFECRPLEGDTYLLISFRAREADYESEIDNYLDVVDTIAFGEPPAKSSNSGTTSKSNDTNLGRDGQKNDDNNSTHSGDQTPRDPVLKGTTYTGGAWDYTVKWDKAIWTAKALTPEDGYEGVSLSSDNASGWVEAIASYDGDPEQCVQTTAEGLPDLDGVSNVSEEARMDLPQTDRDAAVALYSYTYTGNDGDTLDFVEYIECRELVSGEAVLRVTILTPLSTYADEIPVWEKLLANIKLGGGNSTSTSNSGTTDKPSSNGNNSANGDLPGVDGNEYSSPQFPFTLTWGDSWEAVAATDADAGTTLTLSNGISTVLVFGGDFPKVPTDCVDALAAVAAEGDGVSGFDVVSNDQGEPQTGGNDSFAYTFYSLSIDDVVYFDYIQCTPAPSGDYVVAVIYQMPAAQLATELTALEELLNGLQLN